MAGVSGEHELAERPTRLCFSHSLHLLAWKQLVADELKATPTPTPPPPLAIQKMLYRFCSCLDIWLPFLIPSAKQDGILAKSKVTGKKPENHIRFNEWVSPKALLNCVFLYSWQLAVSFPLQFAILVTQLELASKPQALFFSCGKVALVLAAPCKPSERAPADTHLLICSQWRRVPGTGSTLSLWKLGLQPSISLPGVIILPLLLLWPVTMYSLQATWRRLLDLTRAALLTHLFKPLAHQLCEALLTCIYIEVLLKSASSLLQRTELLAQQFSFQKAELTVFCWERSEWTHTYFAGSSMRRRSKPTKEGCCVPEKMFHNPKLPVAPN